MKYGSYEHWLKGGKSIPCISRMHLWIALNSMKIRAIEQRQLSEKELKDIINSFPEDTNNCRCSKCRYFRIFGGGKK